MKKMSLIFSIILTITLLALNLNAQVTITGTVSNAIDGSPIKNIRVRVQAAYCAPDFLLTPIIEITTKTNQSGAYSVTLTDSCLTYSSRVLGNSRHPEPYFAPSIYSWGNPTLSPLTFPNTDFIFDRSTMLTKDNLRLKIQSIRKTKQISQRELARQAKIAPSTLSHFLTGRTHNLDTESVYRLNKWLGTTYPTRAITATPGNNTVEKIRYVIQQDESLTPFAQNALVRLMEDCLAHQTNQVEN